MISIGVVNYGPTYNLSHLFLDIPCDVVCSTKNYSLNKFNSNKSPIIIIKLNFVRAKIFLFRTLNFHK